MASKIRFNFIFSKNNYDRFLQSSDLVTNLNRGLSLVELLVAITILMLLTTVIFVNVSPRSNRLKAMDTQRLNDLSLLERVITEYRADNGSYPDSNNVTRTSHTLPSGSSSLASSQNGWIVQNLRTYTTRLPIDPINDDTFHYIYIRSDDTFELDARLAELTNLMETDGGNDSTMYETGSNKYLISP
jgi:type II secretory pathway pseudopilin PulG